jgi:hypothetical protein
VCTQVAPLRAPTRLFRVKLRAWHIPATTRALRIWLMFTCMCTGQNTISPSHE